FIILYIETLSRASAIVRLVARGPAGPLGNRRRDPCTGRGVGVHSNSVRANAPGACPMSVLGKLVGFGLRQVIGDTHEKVADAVEGQFRDHSQTLPRALARAADRAWQAVGVALVGEGSQCCSFTACSTSPSTE